MIRSMTSFGRSNSEEGKKRVFTVEMKSVNSRYLDVNIRMPKSIISLEEEIRKMISNSLNRGKVDVFINIKNYNEILKRCSETIIVVSEHLFCCHVLFM